MSSPVAPFWPNNPLLDLVAAVFKYLAALVDAREWPSPAVKYSEITAPATNDSPLARPSVQKLAAPEPKAWPKIFC